MSDAAFFPLTMPFTTGPGTISVAIALGSNEPSDGALAQFLIATSLAAAAVAGVVWLAWADILVALLGRARHGP